MPVGWVIWESDAETCPRSEDKGRQVGLTWLQEGWVSRVLTECLVQYFDFTDGKTGHESCEGRSRRGERSGPGICNRV